MAYDGSRESSTYPVGMARTHLTLAALATAAVPGLDLVEAQTLGSAGGSFDSALLTARDGRHFAIRMPRNERAESEQSADVVALRALSAGVRTRLHFSLSSFAGQTACRGTRAIVYEFVYGTKVSLADLGPSQATSVGRAIAAIHALPTSFVTDAGLPVLTAVDCLRSSMSVMDRASSTGMVPAALLERWQAATEDSKLWQFVPTVINGAMTADSFLFDGGDVTGVLGWHELRVGDPARDLFWLLGARAEAVPELGFDAYNEARGGGDRQIRQRAMLYAELELAKWLLHGVDTHDTAIVDDAVEMLSGLVDDVHNDITDPLNAQTLPIIGIDEVEAMLERSERAV